MAVDRAGKPLTKGMTVGVLPHNTRDTATVEEAESLGYEFSGVVWEVEDGYVTVVSDDPMRGTVTIRSDLVVG